MPCFLVFITPTPSFSNQVLVGVQSVETYSTLALGPLLFLISQSVEQAQARQVSTLSTEQEAGRLPTKSYAIEAASETRRLKRGARGASAEFPVEGQRRSSRGRCMAPSHYRVSGHEVPCFVTGRPIDRRPRPEEVPAAAICSALRLHRQVQFS